MRWPTQPASASRLAGLLARATGVFTSMPEQAGFMAVENRSARQRGRQVLQPSKLPRRVPRGTSMSLVARSGPGACSVAPNRSRAAGWRDAESDRGNQLV
jgi:hypothetical protein